MITAWENFIAFCLEFNKLDNSLAPMEDSLFKIGIPVLPFISYSLILYIERLIPYSEKNLVFLIHI